MNDRMNALSATHQFKGQIDVVQCHGVADGAVKGNVSFPTTLDIDRKLASASYAREG